LLQQKIKQVKAYGLVMDKYQIGRFISTKQNGPNYIFWSYFHHSLPQCFRDVRIPF